MTTRPIDYLQLTRDALRGVMAAALGQAAEHGLSGEQHFFVTFRTNHPGVDLPSWLRERYPDEMTIVIQHEYEDLAVTEDRFSVALSFSNRSVTLVVPFASIVTFADPSVNFQLEIPGVVDEQIETDAPAAEDAEPAESEEKGDATVVSLDAFRKK